jgi:hypothetical protein
MQMMPVSVSEKIAALRQKGYFAGLDVTLVTLTTNTIK